MSTPSAGSRRHCDSAAATCIECKEHELSPAHAPAAADHAGSPSCHENQCFEVGRQHARRADASVAGINAQLAHRHQRPHVSSDVQSHYVCCAVAVHRQVQAAQVHQALHPAADLPAAGAVDKNDAQLLQAAAGRQQCVQVGAGIQPVFSRRGGGVQRQGKRCDVLAAVLLHPLAQRAQAGQEALPTERHAEAAAQLCAVAAWCHLRQTSTALWRLQSTQG